MGRFFLSAIIIHVALFFECSSLNRALLRRTFSVKPQNFMEMHASTSEILEINKLEGFRDVINNFDAFIIDQWGVLHDGKVPYHGVIECLKNLKDQGKILILLSNSSKKKTNVYKGLSKIGIDTLYFDDCVTSGEVSWHTFVENSNQKNSDENRILKKAFVIGNGEDDQEYMSSAGYEISSPEYADIIVARGTFSVLDGTFITSYPIADNLMKDIDIYLQRCLLRNLKMFVTNPDIMRPGSNSPMPGQIGERYTSIGGDVSYIGKPHNEVYIKCFDLIQSYSTKPIPRSRICGIGDSLLHDIKGANDFGIVSIWTANGVHANEMHTSEGAAEFASDDIMNDILDRYKVKPHFMIPKFRW